MPAAVVQSPRGPGRPIVAGPGDMSVDEFLVDPKRIQRTLDTLPGNYYLTDLFFVDGGITPAGVVLYNQLLDLDMYLDVDANRQPQNVEPAMEFPNVGWIDRAPLVALIGKMGGYFRLAKEQIDADRRDLVRTGLFRLGNVMTQVVNANALNAMITDPTVVANCTVPASGVWTSAGTNDPFIDIDVNVNSMENGNDLGYTADIAVIHPDAKIIVKTWARKNLQLPRETPGNPLFSKDLVGIGGLDWVVSRRCPRTSMILASRQRVGEVDHQQPPFTDVVPEPLRRSQVVLAGRSDRFIVTDPYAVRVVTGIIT